MRSLYCLLMLLFCHNKCDSIKNSLDMTMMGILHNPLIGDCLHATFMTYIDNRHVQFMQTCIVSHTSHFYFILRFVLDLTRIFYAVFCCKQCDHESLHSQ